MATKVHMEALSPTMEEGQLVRWLKSEGDAVKEGDVLAEIETDKATMELVARGSGVLQNITLKEGGTAPVGEVIAVIAAEGEAAEAPAKSGGDAKAGSEAEPKAEVKESSTAAASTADARASKAGADAEADAEAAEEEPADEPGEDDTKLAAAAKTKSDDAAEREPAREPASEASRGRQSDAAGERVKASPLARRLAEESGVDLATVEGSGPGGRITKRDIEAASERGAAPAAGAEKPARAGEAQKAAPAAGVPAAAARVEAGPDSEEVPVTQMRKAIAKRLVQSIGPVPTFYLTIECDMTRLMELRARVNSALEKDGVKTSINDFIIRSVAAALARHPEVNASWGDNVIVRHHRVHVGVAVAIDDGLITPIVRDADRKRVRDIATEVKELAGRAREKKLKPEEYTGATFSISNLGMFGIVEFTAIINPPEAGIIAVGAVEDRPVVVDGDVVIQPRMRMTMSCDHRVVDGAMGAKFLQTVRELIEDPMMMIA